jgi:hypothetical protein
MGARRVVLTEHGRSQASRRGLAEELVVEVASRPEQIIAVRPGREIRQSRMLCPSDGRTYLVRTVVDLGGWDIRVVTVYRTSRVARYWRTP